MFRASQCVVQLRISRPRHGTEFNVAALRTNGGIDFEFSVIVRTEKEFKQEISGRSVCLYVNGSAFTGSPNCVAIGSTHGPVIPSTSWQPGRAWLHIELCETRSLVSTRMRSGRDLGSVGVVGWLAQVK